MQWAEHRRVKPAYRVSRNSQPAGVARSAFTWEVATRSFSVVLAVDELQLVEEVHKVSLHGSSRCELELDGDGWRWSVANGRSGPTCKMLISNGNTLGGANDFSSVAALSGCCPVPVAPSTRSAIINWKMDPVGLPTPNTAPSVLPTAIPLSPTGSIFFLLYLFS